jgi:hypothetical protein
MGDQVPPEGKDRMAGRWVAVTVGAMALAGACNSSPPSGSDVGGVEARAPPASQRFVAFRQPAFTMEALETAIAPPVAIGSTVAGDLLASSDSTVVSIDGAGNLVAHRNGTAVVRSRSGSTLIVTVDAVASIRIVPDHLELAAGEQAVVHARTDEHEIAAEALHWETTSPNTAVASGTTVHAGHTAGEATLTARSGLATAALRVTVRPAVFSIRARASASVLKRGEIVHVAAEVPAGVAVSWSSSNSRVLELLRDGTYHAGSRGIAEACAAGGGQISCARIRVR